MVEHFCEECRRVYPTGRLLELHILESHDTLFKLMAANQNMVYMHTEPNTCGSHNGLGWQPPMGALVVSDIH